MNQGEAGGQAADQLRSLPDAALGEEAARRIEELRRSLELARSANEAKSELLNRMSHELRTPLSAVIGFIELLQLEELPEQQAAFVHAVARGAEQLSELIDEVLEISRIETGSVSLSLEAVGLQDAVTAGLEKCRDDLLQLGATVMPFAADPDDVHVLADGQRLPQVLGTLITAVARQRSRGEVQLLVHHADGVVRLAVTRPELAGEATQLLALPIESLRARRSGIEGAGLGMALARVLLEAMHGTMGVAAMDEGSRLVWIELESAATPSDSVDGGTHTLTSPRTVLYAEDTVTNIRLMEQILARRPGITLLPAMMGGIALDMARQEHPDAILLDLHLPDISGEAVLQQLQADPDTRDIPVLMLSASRDPQREAALLAAGAREILPKPLNVRRLLEVLDELFEG